MSLWLLWKTIGWEKRLLSGKWRTQKTYAVQDTLPPLPVPKLRDTFRRLLDSVRPIWPHDEYEQMVNLVKELGAAGGSGEQLQRLLVRRARSNPQTAWIEEWWEKEYLLSSRLPLPGFCNWYGLDRPDTPCMSQVICACAHAACMRACVRVCMHACEFSFFRHAMHAAVSARRVNF